MSENQAVWYLPGPDNQPEGPHTTDLVLELCREGKLNKDTLCWREGMDNWRPLLQVKPFCEIFHDLSTSTATATKETQELDSLGRMLGKAVSLTKKKAKIASLKMSIGKYEKRKQELLFELGKMLYEKESDNEMLSKSPYVEKIQQAKAQDKSIQALHKEIEAIENTGFTNPQKRNSKD